MNEDSLQWTSYGATRTTYLIYNKAAAEACQCGYISWPCFSIQTSLKLPDGIWILDTWFGSEEEEEEELFLVQVSLESLKQVRRCHQDHKMTAYVKDKCCF